ncbi:MAG: DNA double-strand break repair nuclease NurA [Actinobacteria bacterium]|nr:DNA double-strand break repair nuclease NurA [Actinomycetota bacterium]
MLNLSKLYPQIANLGSYRGSRKNELGHKLALARQRLTSSNEADLRTKAESAMTSWLVALPTDERPSTIHPKPEFFGDYVVVATDGSQIAPTRDATGPLHLVNVGAATIAYGANASAKLESEPHLAFEDADMFVPFGGEEREVNGQVLAAKRDLMEYGALRKRIAKLSSKLAIGLVDGTLILWHVELRADKLKGLGTADLKWQVFQEMFSLFAEAKRAGVPVAGYISASGSTDVVNLLKIGVCAKNEIDCDKQCSAIPRSRRECAIIDGLTDVTLFRSILQVGERSAVFESFSSKASYILEAYPEEDRVCFFYLNVGSEVARVEIPRWIAEDPKLKDQVHTLLFDQAVKGRGYPVSLAEAHEQAVVKGPDRDNFERLIEMALVKQGVRFEDSRKSLLKRRGFV